MVDEDSTSIFIVYVGECQAIALYEAEEDVKIVRTLSHQLLYGLIEAGGGSITHAGVIDIQNDIYIGEVGISTADGDLTFDARPSDAVTLAALAKAPIRIDRQLLADYGEDAGSYLGRE